MLSFVYQICFKDYEPVVTIGQTALSMVKISSFQLNYSPILGGLNIHRSIFDLNYESPVTFAAFESHFDSLYLWLNLGAGGGCLKTIKQSAHTGNNRPRLQQVSVNGEEHLINALGLPGVGIHGLLEKVKQSKLPNYLCPIGLSIGGNSLQEYKDIMNIAVNQESHLKISQQYYELNISCPNTETGQSLHDNMQDLESLLMYCRSITDKVIVVKVSPDASNQNLCDVAACAKGVSKVTLNAGNTQYKKCQDLGLNPSAISIGGGGLSGPILYKRTLEMAQLLSQFQLPLISTGGIKNASQVIELQKYGVEVVGLATQLVKDPYEIVSINKELARRNKV